MPDTHEKADGPPTQDKGKGKAVEFDALRVKREAMSGRTTPSSEVLSEDDIPVHAAPRSPIEMMQEPEAPSFEQDEFRYVMSLYRQKRYFEQLADAFRPGTSAGENEGSQSGSDHFEDDGIHLAEPVGSKSSDRGRYKDPLEALGYIREAFHEMGLGDLAFERRHRGPSSGQETGEGTITHQDVLRWVGSLVSSLRELFERAWQEYVGSSSGQRTSGGTSAQQLGDRVRRDLEHESNVTDSDAMSDQEADEDTSTNRRRYRGILETIRDRRVMMSDDEDSDQGTGEGTITYQDVLRIAQESSDEDEQEHVGPSSIQRTSEGTSGRQSGGRVRRGSENENDMTEGDEMSDQEAGEGTITYQDVLRIAQESSDEDEQEHVGPSSIQRTSEGTSGRQSGGRVRQGQEHESDMTEGDEMSDQEAGDRISAWQQRNIDILYAVMGGEDSDQENI